MEFRVRFDVQGGHVHCGLFCAKQLNMTFAKCGDFVVRRGEEFASLLRAFSGAQFVGVEGGSGISAAITESDELSAVTD
jgi:hypothetical protein